MRILLVSPETDGVWFVWLLKHEGHDVQWVTQEEKYADSLKGLVPPPLSRAPDPYKYDLIVFDSAGLGDSADLARTVTPTIGSSELADRLEHDRIFGLEAMEEAGIKVPEWEAFSDRGAAIAWLKENGKRTVLKPIDDEHLNKDSTYCSTSAEDMIHFIENKLDPKCKEFVLQEFVVGTEISTEAWWTGKEWVAINHTLEEKKFMAGGLGPNTGCAGNTVWMPAQPNHLFEQGLGKVAHLLEVSGFVGMVDLNTIVTEGGVYGLEWTPRFGYEGTCNLVNLLPIPFGDFLYDIAIGKAPVIAGPKHKFVSTIRISVPPYPYADTNRRKMQVPINGLDTSDLSSFILYDAQMEGDQLITSGTYNAIGAPIAGGVSIPESFDKAKEIIKALQIPDLQWRNDICECVEKRYRDVASWGWLKSVR